MAKLTINGMELELLPDIKYRRNYWQIFNDIKAGKIEEYSSVRWLILNDLFFVIYFILGEGKSNYRKMNCEFIVKACSDIHNGAKSNTLDVWAREHLKSSIITIAETIQFALTNPDYSTCIFSYARPVAKKFLFEIKSLFENSTILKMYFPMLNDIAKLSPMWSLDDGLILKRLGNRKEPTIYAAGLIEGMPTGMHFDRMVFDDLVTEDIAGSYEVMEKVKVKFDSAQNLGTDGGVVRIIGTYYNHNDPYVDIRDRVDENGVAIYITRKKPATDNGLADGKPVFLSEERLRFLRSTKTFNCQQLLDPTPTADMKLRVEFLQEIEKEFLPKDLYRFMVIDPAGDNETKKGDAWAFHVVGIEPKVDDLGCSKLYILDSFIDTMTESQATDMMVKMYLNGGMISQLGYERLSNTTPAWLDHGLRTLRARGRYVSEENHSLVALSHGGRNKVSRITGALQWPLNNSCLFISSGVSKQYKDRLKEEMVKFPSWHDDGLDALAYVYDIISDYNFQSYTKFKPYDYKKANLCIV